MKMIAHNWADKICLLIIFNLDLCLIEKTAVGTRLSPVSTRDHQCGKAEQNENLQKKTFSSMTLGFAASFLIISISG